MSDLVLLLPSDMSQPWEWMLSATREQGRAISTEQKSDLAQGNHTRIIAVIAGMNVITKKHMLGNLQKKQALQAVGFSIEEELATSLSNTHIAFAEDGDRIAVISKTSLDDTITSLEDAGLTAGIICADYDSIQDAAEFLYGGRFVKKNSDQLGYSIEQDVASFILDKDKKLPHNITSAAQFLNTIIDNISEGYTPINLLQGEYDKRTHVTLGEFKRSAWLAVACSAIFLVLFLGQGLYFNQKTNQAKTKINTIYTQLFPDKAVPKNPVVSVLRAQASANQSKGELFLRLSSILALSTKDLGGIEIVSLGYDKNRSQLSMSIIYSGFDDVEKLKMAIAKHGGVFLESGTRQNDTGLVGDAVLKEAS